MGLSVGLFLLAAICLWLLALNWWVIKQVTALKYQLEVLRGGVNRLVKDLNNNALASNHQLASLQHQLAAFQSDDNVSKAAVVTTHAPLRAEDGSPGPPRSGEDADGMFATLRGLSDQVDQRLQGWQVDAGSGPGPSTAVRIATDVQDAVRCNDQQALRAMASQELNLTARTEDALCRQEPGAIQLEAVLGGGSYLLIEREGGHWLVPSIQTLAGFRTSQPAKGLFCYQREPAIRSAELRRAAELRAIGALWELKAIGLVAVPEER
ncbi:MAG: hypothetical protein VKK97_07145 [Synechococcaceae cyanobacterium]|nr:hypothetical protein [Synechococcaceae cyanobacterium]